MEASLSDVTDYKKKYNDLVLQMKISEEGFGQKRAQFRQLYLDCEAKLKNEKEIGRQFQIQIQELTKQTDALKSENEGIRIAAQLSEESKQEEYVALKVKHQEEIASLQHIWQEASKENQSRLAREFEDERKKLLDANSKLEQRIRGDTKITDEAKSNNGESLMSMMSNAFSKKTSTSNLAKTKGIDGPAAVNLEGDQQQAQEDVIAWKNVVGPLEAENQALKSQLLELQKKVSELEKKASEKSYVHVYEYDKEKQKELQKYLDAERSARTDLEMYVAVLNTQKGVLQEDADKLRRELHNVCRLFEQEKMSHGELKETWKLANEQFLQQQQNLDFENNTMKQLLTQQQLEQLSRDVRKERSNIAKQIEENTYEESNSKNCSDKINSSESSKNDLISFNKSEEHKSTDGLVNTFKKKLTPNTQRKNRQVANQDKKPKLGDSILNSLFPSAYQAKQFNELLKDDSNTKEKPLMLSSSSDSEDDDNLEQAIMKQNLRKHGGVEIAEEVDEHAPLTVHAQSPSEKTSLKKSSSSDNILKSAITRDMQLLQEKSLSQGDVSWSSAFTKSPSYNDEVDSKLSLNETGWSTISDDYSHTCMMCQNYEKQLQRLQKEFMGLKEKEEHCTSNVLELKDQLEAEKEKSSTMEKSFESAIGDTKSQINIYKVNQTEVDKQVEILRQQFQQFQTDIVKEMKLITDERSNAENSPDKASLLENELQELQTNYKSNQEQLKGEIMFLRDRALAEQFDRESTEGVLQQDLNDARQEILKLRHQLEDCNGPTNKDETPS